MVFILLAGMIPWAFAASGEATDAAETLYSLGLFQGTGKNTDGTPKYELDRAPTRNEAVTMLVRLLGKEDEAKAGVWEIPFTDVEEWAKPYVGYAYANKLTNGTGATTFDGEDLVSATQYLTFVLRALGYESGKDFEWDQAWVLSDQIGITNGEFNAENNEDFLRGNVAEISVSALPANMKGASFTLAEKLIDEGVFTEEQYQSTTTEINVPTVGELSVNLDLLALSPDDSFPASDWFIRWQNRDMRTQICDVMDHSGIAFASVDTSTIQTPQDMKMWQGTRVTIIDRDESGYRYIVAYYSADGNCYLKDYTIRKGIEETIPTPTVGDTAVNNTLMMLSPDTSLAHGNDGWYLAWDGKDVSAHVCSILDNSSIDFVAITSETRKASFSGPMTRVEITDNAEWGYWYVVEYIDESGNMYNTHYGIRPSVYENP